MNKKDEQQVLSAAMQELISSRPHWIVRNGNLFFLLVIVLLLIMTWFVKYPDVIRASVKLTTANPPELLVSNADGRLGKIFVNNEQHVVQGQLLALLESRVNYSQVLLLRSWIFQIETSMVYDDSDWLSTNPLPALTGLGDLQYSYQHFQSLLHDVPGVPDKAYNRKKWNELRRGLKPFVSSENNSRSRRKAGDLTSAFLLVKSKLNAWAGEYLITAPASGKVIFASVLKENQRVSPDQGLFYLQSSPMNFYGLLKVARAGLGKIRSGQHVLIQVDGYPGSEFGYVTGAIDSILINPSGGDSLLIAINLPNGLETSDHKYIPFRNNLSASASIKIDDSRLLDKFLGTLKKIVVK